MVIWMADIAEACEPPPCVGAVCACAGGGLAGAGIPLFPPTCTPYIEPCNNGNDFCTKCYSDSGCAGGSKPGGDPGKMKCEMKNGKIKCHLADK